jgi:hypothetical protein
MVEISIQDQARDEETSANAGILRIGRVSAALPNKFATTAELNATRVVGAKDTLPRDVVVSAKLMYPDLLKARPADKDEEVCKHVRQRTKKSLESGKKVLAPRFRKEGH